MSDGKLPPLDLTEALARGHEPRRHLWPLINHLHPPIVMSRQEADIGPWSDDHPLNHGATQRAEYERLFADKEATHGKES